MTYRELLYKATRLCDKGEITLGEYFEMTKPLDRQVEQEPILDKIRTEIEAEKNAGGHTWYVGGLDFAMSIIYKYMAESEDKK